jgi:hypothetical protein
MRLTATREFQDKQGVTHRQGESFECQDEQEAQDYIRRGQAKEEQGQTQGQGREHK